MRDKETDDLVKCPRSIGFQSAGKLSFSSLPIVKAPSEKIVRGSKAVTVGNLLLRSNNNVVRSNNSEAIVRCSNDIVQTPELQGDNEWRLTTEAREELDRTPATGSGFYNWMFGCSADEAKESKPAAAMDTDPIGKERRPSKEALEKGRASVLAAELEKGMPGIPSPPPPGPAGAARFQELKVGDKVLAMSASKARRTCTVLELKGQWVKLHYDGFDASYDEWLDKTSERILEKEAPAAPSISENLPAEPPEGERVAPKQMQSGARGKDFDWIRFDNQEDARAMRRKISGQTRQAVLAEGYVLKGRNVKLRRMRQMMEGTKMIAPSLGNCKVPPAASSSAKTKVTLSESLAMDAAVELSNSFTYSSSNSVAVISAASSYHCGGAFISGGRHALEEAMCVQSTLFKSIKSEEDQFLKDKPPARHGEFRAYIPEDGVVLSPSVEVFRTGSGDGYSFLKEPVQLAAILSIGMYNKNGKMSDCPVDAPSTKVAYNEGVKQKFRSAFVAALEAGTRCLVIPDVGCGVYGNDAAEVGIQLGKLLRQEFWGQFQEVVLVGKPEFGKAARMVVEEIGLALEKVRGIDDSNNEPAGYASFSGSAPTAPPPIPKNRLQPDTPQVRSGPPQAPPRSPQPPQVRPRTPDDHYSAANVSTTPPSPTPERNDESGNSCKFCGRPCKGHFDTCCRRCASTKGDGSHDKGCLLGPVFLGGGGGSSSRESSQARSPRPNAAIHSVQPPMCKFGCGRRAKAGTTRSGKPLDTCCRACAVSKGGGGHDPDCGDLF